eukprot:2079347-Rhodomonas_salina.1
MPATPCSVPCSTLLLDVWRQRGARWSAGEGSAAKLQDTARPREHKTAQHTATDRTGQDRTGQDKEDRTARLPRHRIPSTHTHHLPSPPSPHKPFTTHLLGLLVSGDLVG